MIWIATGWAKRTFGGTVWFLPDIIESTPQCRTLNPISLEVFPVQEYRKLEGAQPSRTA
jgi:hypothetical protein